MNELARGRLGGLRSAPIALALTVAAPDVRAAELEWSAPAECPDKRDVAREVGRLVGQPLEAVDQADFAVEIVRAGTGFELTLRRAERASDEHGSRRLRGKTCSEVTDAAAVAIAMAIQGEGANGHGTEWQTAPSEQPRSSPETAERNTPGVPRDNAPRAVAEPSPFHVLGAIAGVVDFGALPDAAPGAELDISGGYRKVRLTALGALFAAVDAPASGGGGGEFRLWVLGLLSCLEQPLRGYALAACGGFELGRMSGQGVGVSHSRERSASWQAARLEGGLFLPAAGPFGVAVRAGATFPLQRPEFVLDGTEVVHRASPVTGRFLIGFEFRP